MRRIGTALFSLLLIAATPSPSDHHETQETNARTEQRNYSASPIYAPSYQAGPEPTLAASRNYTYNYYYVASKAESPPISFQVGTTIVLIIFTGGLWLTSILQWRALKEQADIANNTLALANRPRIKMRGFYVKGDIEQDAAGVKNWEMEIGYELVNYGDTEATLIDSRHKILMNELSRPPDLTMPASYGADEIAPRGTVFKPGESYSFTMKGTVSPESRVRLEPLIEGEHRAAMMHFNPCCLGYIVYKGRIGNSYRTAFCRSLKRQTFPTPYAFETSRDPNYEYED